MTQTATEPAPTARGTAAADIDPRTNLTDLVVAAAERDAGFAMLRRRGDDGTWHDVAAAGFISEVRALASGLVAAGVEPGDRVALMSRTRYEWTLVDVAIWFAGAVTVPIYETSSADQAAWILADSGAVACVVESADHAQVVDQARESASDLRLVFSIEDGDLDRLAAGGSDRAAGAADRVDLDERRRRAGRDDLATIVYTSGTTGRPKGCRLTHGNFMVLVEAATTQMPEVFADGGACLLFLPLAHVFARFVEILCLTRRITLGHTADVTSLTDDLAGFAPTFLFAVPRVFEKMYARAQDRAVDAGRGRVFARATDVAVAWSEATEGARGGGRGPGLPLRAQHAVFDRLVYRKLRAALGGRARWAVSGGGPLSPRLAHFFRGAGATVLQGYGLTETSAPTCVNRPGLDRVTTVGPPLPGAAVRIEANGEVLVSGPHVSPGYWGEGAAGDAEAYLWADGERWLRTGDLGRLDDDGHLTITGRIKEILVTAGGKNVAPAALEDSLRTHPLISQAIVVGDGRPYIAALVTLDDEALPGWLRTQGRPALDIATAARDDGVLAAVQGAVDTANRSVSRAESIRRVRVLDRDFTEADGHLTPSLKLKRASVMRDFADEVGSLYPPKD